MCVEKQGMPAEGWPATTLSAIQLRYRRARGGTCTPNTMALSHQAAAANVETVKHAGDRWRPLRTIASHKMQCSRAALD